MFTSACQRHGRTETLAIEPKPESRPFESRQGVGDPLLI